MNCIATDSHSGAEVYRLVDDPRPADNIYGEQPYSDASGRKIAIRFYPEGTRQGELAVLDIESGRLDTIIQGMPRFPAFHGWSDHLYCQEAVGEQLLLRRWSYATLEREDVVVLPADGGAYSYGSVSPDHVWYAVSAKYGSDRWTVMLMDLRAGSMRVWAESSDRYLFKHEQFSGDGSNRLLIQANVIPEVKEVHLGTLDVAGEGMTRLAADTPHTPRPTGHEAWIGATRNVFYSTDFDEDRRTNLFTVGFGDTESVAIPFGERRAGHVSVSRCGRYWIADAPGEDGIPIYAGAFGGGFRRLITSETVHDGQQWSHTHPYLTADNRWLIFTSTRCGPAQVFGARVPDEFWASLHEEARG